MLVPSIALCPCAHGLYLFIGQSLQIPGPQHLCRTKSCCSSSLIGYRSELLLFFLTFSSSILRSRTSHLCVSLFLAGRTLMVYSQSLLILKRFVSALKDGDAICLACWFWFRTWLFCLFMSIYGQLPDYHDIIKHPMDFSTIRKKLDKGAYSNLEQFEVGYRICLGCLGFSSTKLHVLVW